MSDQPILSVTLESKLDVSDYDKRWAYIRCGPISLHFYNEPSWKAFVDDIIAFEATKGRVFLEQPSGPEEVEDEPQLCELCKDRGLEPRKVGIALCDDGIVGPRWVCEEHQEELRSAEDPAEQMADQREAEGYNEDDG